MIYAQRDTNGRLLYASKEPFDHMTAEESESTPDVNLWLRAQDALRLEQTKLQQSDINTIRVIEDLVNLLVEKGLINFQELPLEARTRLDERAIIRAEVDALSDLFKTADYQTILDLTKPV